jgi:hypothetical protein
MNLKSLALGLCLALDVSTSSAASVPTTPPGDFFGVPGTYTVDSDVGAMTGPDGFHVAGTVIDGTLTFRFDDFLLLPGATIQTVGDLPVAFLSDADMMISGPIQARSGGFDGALSGGTGAGPGGGSSATDRGAGGGGFGGAGGRGHDNFGDPGGAGGPAYGDIEQMLQGGSGGGGASGFFGALGGGAGGGALRLQAAGRMTVFANISVNGQLGGSGRGYGGGGGAGGGLILSAAEIIAAAFVSADGGTGGVGTFDNGGGGGGGRILIETLPGGFLNFGTITANGGAGGSSFFGFAESGMPGEIIIRTVPEPTALILALAGVGIPLHLLRRRKQ